MEQVLKIEAAIEGLMRFFWLYFRTYLALLFSPHDASKLIEPEARTDLYISPLSFFAASAFVFSIVQTFVLVDAGKLYAYLFTNEIFTLAVKPFLLHTTSHLSEKHFSIWGFVTTILPVTLISMVFASVCARFLEGAPCKRQKVKDFLLYLAGFQCVSFCLSVFLFLIVFVSIDTPFSEVPSVLAAAFFFYSVGYSLLSISLNYARHAYTRGNMQNTSKYLLVALGSSALIFVFLETVEAKQSLLKYVNQKEVKQPNIEPLGYLNESPKVEVSRVNGTWQIKGAVQVFNPYKEPLILHADRVGRLKETNTQQLDVHLTASRWATKEGPAMLIASNDVAWVEYTGNLSECNFRQLQTTVSGKTRIPYTFSVDLYTHRGTKKSGTQHLYFHFVGPKDTPLSLMTSERNACQ
ncbi:membrane hypothetical protein [Vibrio nigripulchritudo SFn27]|uniref:Uncharacterized protein n=1 Tax=Vibrio nigripulchritudo TaxID=28173 RepID=A0A9P1NK98_9VIBR|nr:hypothetical protein [Vibrio nigripulchritudo]CBJ93163.1 Protein of unknown function [Vibrio nigripulchritudo]CCN38685.1 membrane hypothetical protein [Vibrio nigripulchritudo AM115]CCN44994.1 membrane hypothetical protein [Vibrio nigripulchritudo FTn2]CCN79752.1 membrane hypothetical protein [Vibrio nigripulchritudo SO65]CCN91974.1 membrane hypothetical protein [Vibrio nigripulchritudo SFn27]